MEYWHGLKIVKLTFFFFYSFYNYHRITYNKLLYARDIPRSINSWLKSGNITLDLLYFLYKGILESHLVLNLTIFVTQILCRHQADHLCQRSGDELRSCWALQGMSVTSLPSFSCKIWKSHTDWSEFFLWVRDGGLLIVFCSQCKCC